MMASGHVRRCPQTRWMQARWLADARSWQLTGAEDVRAGRFTAVLNQLGSGAGVRPRVLASATALLQTILRYRVFQMNTGWVTCSRSRISSSYFRPSTQPPSRNLDWS